MPGLSSWETMGNLLNLCVSFFYLKWVWYQPHKDAPCTCSPNAPMFSLASLNFHVLCLCWNILSLPSLHLANSYSSLMSHFRCSFLQKTFCDSNVWMTYIFYIVLWHPILYSCLFHSTVPFNCFCCLFVSLLESQDFVLFTPVSSRRTEAGNIPSQPLHLLDDDSQKSTLWSLLPWAQTAS